MGEGQGYWCIWKVGVKEIWGDLGARMYNDLKFCIRSVL